MTVENLNISVKTNADKAAVKLLTLGSALEKVQGSATSVGGGAGARAAKGVEQVGKAAEKANKPMNNFLSSLKRIAFYRIIRGIIKSISQAMQEGLEKAYLFSSSMSGEGNRFAAAMDRMKSAGNQMKGQLGSAFISLLAAVEPVLITLINLVTKVADAISQLLAAFTGKTYLKANATAAQFADTMARGGAAAKEWKNQLLGFDEINRLNAPSDGGGGGGTNPLAGYEMVDTPIDDRILKFVNNIKEKLQPAVDRLKEAFDRLKEAWNRFSDSLGSSAFSQFVEDVIVLASGAVINGLTVVADVLALIANILSGDLWSAEMSFRQLLYDIIVLIADLMVGVTNLAMDALIMLAGGIDSVIGTNFADYLQADKDAFNAMYNAAVQSDEGLFGLKRTLGLTTDATKKTADEADGFVEVLGVVGVTAETAEQQMSDLKSSVDWLLDGFLWFGEEVGWIITSLFSPFAELCAWIDSAIQGLSIFNGLKRFSNPNYDVYNDASMWTSNFATGGFPDEGQLFMAREAGPELVGTMGGRTAVANNDQIVEGIRQGVYDAVIAANNNGNGDVRVKVYLDSREIKAGQQRLDRAWGV